MSTYEPKRLSKDDWKDIKSQTIRLMKRMAFSFLTFNILLLSAFTFFLRDWLGHFNEGLFSFVFLSLVLGFESSFYDAAEGKSIGPESFLKKSRDFLKLEFYRNMILIRNFLMMSVYLILGFLLHKFASGLKPNYSFWQDSFFYANGLVIVGLFLSITFERFDFKYLLMRNKNIDYSAASYLHQKVLDNNFGLLRLDVMVGPLNIFLLLFCILTNLHLVYLFILLFWLCLKVSIYRVVFEDKGKLSEVKQEEINVVPSSV